MGRESIEITHSDWSALVDTQSRQQAQIEAIVFSLQTTTEQIAVLAADQRLANEQRALQAKQFEALDSDLRKNSELTRDTLQAANDLKDLVTTAKTGGKIIRWATPTLVAVAALAGLVKGYIISFMGWFRDD